MSRKQLFIFGSIAIATVGLVVFLTWLGFVTNKPANTGADGVTYTDTNSGQVLTALPDSQHGDNDSGSGPLNEIAITGMDDFIPIISQDQASSILNDLTTFIRARSGTAAGARAAVLNGHVNQTGSNPNVYQFTLVLLQSDAHYDVTITMPTTATIPTVTFGGATQ